MFPELLEQRLPHLTEGQRQRLVAHYQLLMRWNRVLNLTRITGTAALVDQHYVESVFLAERLPAGRLTVVDIGSGAGFPGIPLAVARPECRVRLVEAHQRKAVFLKEAVRGWTNVEVSACRAEELEGCFDWAVTRAVNWRDVEPVAARLAMHAAFLGGKEGPGGPCFVWDPPVDSPAGPGRFLYLGRRVSRETLQA